MVTHNQAACSLVFSSSLLSIICVGQLEQYMVHGRYIKKYYKEVRVRGWGRGMRQEVLFK